MGCPIPNTSVRRRTVKPSDQWSAVRKSLSAFGFRLLADREPTAESRQQLYRPLATDNSPLLFL
jgi:hypothetical protein